MRPCALPLPIIGNPTDCSSRVASRCANGQALIFLTSDHSALQRPIAFAARFMGVPTAFIPHAGVTKGLPPLCFNFAFLDGLHAARQYARYGASNTTVLLAGTPRLDAVMQRRRAEGRRLGICPGLREMPIGLDALVGGRRRAVRRGDHNSAASTRAGEGTLCSGGARLGCVYSDANENPPGTSCRR